MKKHIQEHLKTFVGVTILLICTVLFFTSNELIAKLLPNASELTFVSCKTESEGIVEYTGKEVAPEILELVFEDKDGNEVFFSNDAFEIIQMYENIEIGEADVEVELEGYRNSIVIEDAFQIVLGKVNNLNVAVATKEHVFLCWDRVAGAEGYVVYKSLDKGLTYREVKTVSANSLMMFEDKELESNTMYYYKVAAFSSADDAAIWGAESDAVRHVTPLDVPVMDEAECVDAHSIQVSWNLVDGASGYKVFRSLEENGEFALVADVTDLSINTYTDETCDICVDYFYYVVACQDIEGEVILGEPSNIVNTKTTLDETKLSGSFNSDKTGVSLNWKKVEDADGYEVYKNTGSDYELVKTITDDTLSWSEEGLEAESEVSYKVRAFVDVDGQKEYSDYSNSYTKPMKINYNYSGSGAGNASDITAYAGYPYKWGGKSSSGWDCSGFTYWVMSNVYGVNISTGTAGQASGGYGVSVSDRSQWQVGDILVYKNNGSINHVAIYIGNGQMIHALNDKYDTHIQGVDEYERWDDNNLYSVRRYL